MDDAEIENGGKTKILIVDDDRSNIVALNHILKPAYSTLVAINGESGIQIARQALPDLILLDIVMPDMTGFEVLADLKRESALRKIPVIIITALDSTEDEETGFYLGAVDYITKPFRDPIVRARVKTHLRMAEYIREIERFGMMDPLTGLPNRRSLDLRVNVEWGRSVREKEPLSVLMIDVDNFKDYNDSYGHMQGDVLLQTVALVFSRTVRRAGDFIARWGGEEFTILLPNTDLESAAVIAEQIRANVESTMVPRPNGESTHVTISIGVNTRETGIDSTVSEFLVGADNLLYKAKGEGKNKVCW
ncbi:MAG: diguanylate cyclase [Chitinispirillia bacterium]|nr:diguanylate cyclase [Chitinispirillia bacterium]MCL2241261.1 diguanylate cyclase [Chitinispirillia bacterium]